jgi:hypothetical protein
MPEYLVMWQIELTADSPRQAAELAEEIQRTSDGVYEVMDLDAQNPELTLVDFEQLKENDDE